MSDRPERDAGSPSGTPAGAKPADPEPVVIVVPYRPARLGWKFVPPFLILFLCVGFLGYRASNRNWRGVFGLFDRGTWTWFRRPGATLPAPEFARSTPPETLFPPPETLAEVAGTGQPGAETDKATADIEREAEENRKRIAELERMKEAEARKLTETEDQRRQEARPGRFGLPPAEIERRLAILREQQRRQMDEMMRRQMAWVDDMQRRQRQDVESYRHRFFGDVPGAADPGQPFAMPWPPAMPPLGPAQPDPGAPPRARRFRTPDGGDGWLRESHGPDGSMRFELRWRSSSRDDLPVTPPRPKPGRIFD
jgi:hypothetical protein